MGCYKTGFLGKFGLLWVFLTGDGFLGFRSLVFVFNFAYPGVKFGDFGGFWNLCSGVGLW